VTRTPTPLDALGEEYVQKAIALSPFLATSMGVPGQGGDIPDFSPAGDALWAELNRETLEKLDDIDIQDDVDEVTMAAMRERIGLDLELYDAGENLASLNVLASPVQQMRDIFDLMPTETKSDWEDIAARLAKIPDGIKGYIESLREGVKRGLAPAIRQVNAVLDQVDQIGGPDSTFNAVAARGEAAYPELAGALTHGADVARQAYRDLAKYLREELSPQARQADGFGKERYQRFSRLFLGETVDLEETYQWGVNELRRIIAEQQALAEEIAGPGASIEDALAKINADEKYAIHGVENLQKWMQETADQAIVELDGTQFDIPDSIKTIEAKIAPTHTGGIYYTPPSNDLTRPGRMWWSVPEGIDKFETWQQLTTVYHEGVPGHHLQVGTQTANRDKLNSWRRSMCFVSGHGEGWALYAEKLMDELGYLKDAAFRLGMLYGQRMRAARVVFDIGMHLGLNAPEEWGGKPWDAEVGWEFIRKNIKFAEENARFEFNRYLGWPGQAPAYFIGQRLWEQARDRAKAAAEERGEEFDIKAFHAKALDMGSVPLQLLSTVLNP